MWRNTALSPKVLGIDAAALPFFAIFALHWSWSTFWISVVAAVAFTGAGAFGYPPIACARLLRRKIGGRVRNKDSTSDLRRWHRG
jgi:ABC-type Fe3+-siderophore transport system permease subunit